MRKGGRYLNLPRNIAVHLAAPSPGVLGAWVRLHTGELLCVMPRGRGISLAPRSSFQLPGTEPASSVGSRGAVHSARVPLPPREGMLSPHPGRK